MMVQCRSAVFTGTSCGSPRTPKSRPDNAPNVDARCGFRHPNLGRHPDVVQSAAPHGLFGAAKKRNGSAKPAVASSRPGLCNSLTGAAAIVRRLTTPVASLHCRLPKFRRKRPTACGICGRTALSRIGGAPRAPLGRAAKTRPVYVARCRKKKPQGPRTSAYIELNIPRRFASGTGNVLVAKKAVSQAALLSGSAKPKNGSAASAAGRLERRITLITSSPSRREVSTPREIFNCCAALAMCVRAQRTRWISCGPLGDFCDFTVPLCRWGHHLATSRSGVHATGNEREWWAARGIDPITLAARLWAESEAPF